MIYMKLLVVVGLVCLLCFASVGMSAPKGKQIYLSVSSCKVAFGVSINGVEVVQSPLQPVYTRRLPINQWVFSGENEFVVNIFMDPNWKEELKDQSLEVEIVEYSVIDGEYTPKVIQKIEWNYDKDKTTFPVVRQGRFKLDVPFGDWLWRKGKTFTNETLPLESLKTYISTLHEGLSKKNFSALEPMLRVKATELAKAFYLPESERFKEQQSFFEEELFADSNWGMKPIDFNKMKVRFHANGRLLEIVDSTGKPFLQSLPLEDTTFSLPLWVCYYKNQWVLCR